MQERFYAKIKEGAFYLLPSGTLVKILKIKRDRNSIIIRRYDSYTNDMIEFDIAPMMLTPMFNIDDVARMVSKKKDTLRKYEREGFIPRARQFSLNPEGSYKLRLYSWKDILDLVEALDRRRPVGRPSSLNQPKKINRSDLKKRISRKFDKFDTNLI